MRRLVRVSSIIFGLALACTWTLGQSATNVRASSREGQVFVAWTYSVAASPETFEVYFSGTPFTNTTQATRVGRIFEKEWSGERLQVIADTLGNPNRTWEVPTQAGRVRLAANEGLFVFTPRQNLSGYFAVVPTGITTVTASNRSGLIQVAFDPILDPVRPQLQLAGITPEGYNYRVYASWALGLSDPEAGRPDYPVMANEYKNGAPNLYCVYEPIGGPGAEPYPAIFGLHGGEGNFQFWRPGLYPNIGLDITNGIMIAPTDSLVYKLGAITVNENTRWFGYANTFDPFSGTVLNVEPPLNAVLTDYTCRRMDWFVSWLKSSRSGYRVDPNRISLIGQSLGGRGVSIQFRYRPQNYASAVMLTPFLEPNTDYASTVFGSEEFNIATNLTVEGRIVRAQDVHYWTSPLSNDFDLPFCRLYSGKNDLTASWSQFRITKYLEVEALKLGWALYWDSRVHSISSWGNPPAGEYIAPVRTDLASATAQHRFRSNQSFPTFTRVDTDPDTPGQQPNLGDASTSNSGDPFGSMSGFCEWDTPVETNRSWRADIYIRQLSPKSIDNWTSTHAFTADVTPKRLQVFQLKPGRYFSWVARRLDNNTVISKGTGRANSHGQPTAPGITILPETVAKVRLEFRIDPGGR